MEAMLGIAFYSTSRWSLGKRGGGGGFPGPAATAPGMRLELGAGDDLVAALTQNAAGTIPVHPDLAMQQLLPLAGLVHHLLPILQPASF